MRYHDFEVRIRYDSQDGFVSEVLRSPYARRATSKFYPPFDIESLPAMMVSLEQYIRGSSEDSKTRDLDLVPPSKGRTTADVPSDEVGKALFKSLLSGPVGEVFQQSLAHIRGRGDEEGLRLRLSFDLSDDDVLSLAALPWELLLQPETHDFLARQRHTAVVRDLPLRRSLRSLQLAPPIRILIVESVPIDLSEINSSEETSRIKNALVKISSLEIFVLARPMLGDLRKELLDRRPHVLHFVGHGGFQARSGEGVLFFEDETRRSVAVSGTTLGEILKGIESIQLVILNACNAGALPRCHGQSPFTATAPSILLAGVPAVIAMQFPISDRAAIVFSERFYSYLASGDPVDAAVVEGRLAIHADDALSLEWATPVLFLNTGLEEVLVLPIKATSRPIYTRSAPAGSALRLGVRSFLRWGMEIEREAELILDLKHCFESSNNRRIRDEELWDDVIIVEVMKFFEAAALEQRPIVIDFAAHASIAFLAGYCLEVKSGVDVTILQRTHGGTVAWRGLSGIPFDGPLWLDEPDRLGTAEATDVALALAITDQVIDDVEVYLKRSMFSVSRIINASVAPCPSTTAVRGGAHALHLAQSLSSRIKNRTIREREGTLHLFSAAPNGFLFFLGQLSRRFGSIQLYEYDVDIGRPGAYSPSIQLPPLKRG